MRTPVIAANWKMNKTISEAVSFVQDFAPQVERLSGVEVVICPTFVALDAIHRTLGSASDQIGLGAQNMYKESQGAFTGEISGPMLKDLGCSHVILGHSERRTIFGESDALVGEKVQAAFAAGLRPIVCVGETLQERESGQTDSVTRRQLLAAVKGLNEEQAAQVIIAYEPIWAIGTGRNCDPAAAQETIYGIRTVVAERFGPEVAQAVRIQYGGSVKPENIGRYMAQPDIDGALVGGASLVPASFAAICAAAADVV